MANIYVNHTGSSIPPYDTEAKASTNIQVALDAAASGDTVLIKADQDYVMNGTDQQAAQFDVDTSNSITIKGYYLTPGDQDYGGTYYKTANHGWAVIDANGGAFHVFGVGAKNNLRWYNLMTSNVAVDKYPFYLVAPNEQYGYLVQNCWTVGGSRGAIYGEYLANPIIRDCRFTGVYSSVSSHSIIRFASSCSRGAVIESCEFVHSNTTRSISCPNYGMNLIYNNIFNISGTVTSIIDISYAAFIANNVIYENSEGAITNGIYFASMARSSAVFNNIIAGCTKSINDVVMMPFTINFGGWNCFYNNGSNWTLRYGDIVADPQFMDAPNGDFRLKPTSPCLNRGKLTLGGGYTSIGAWQRKSMLR